MINGNCLVKPAFCVAWNNILLQSWRHTSSLKILKGNLLPEKFCLWRGITFLQFGMNSARMSWIVDLWTDLKLGCQCYVQNDTKVLMITDTLNLYPGTRQRLKVVFQILGTLAMLVRLDIFMMLRDYVNVDPIRCKTIPVLYLIQ